MKRDQEIREQEEERRRQQEKERRKREREQEELRRQERLEHEQRIRAEINKANEACRQKLLDAKEKLDQRQSFKGKEQHQQCTYVLHQMVEDDRAIEWDEVSCTGFKLLHKYSLSKSFSNSSDNNL